MQRHIELNIALIPTPELGDKLTNLSNRLASRYPSIVRLGNLGARLSMAPHNTLYQVPLPVEALGEADAVLTEIAFRTPLQVAEAIGYAYNSDEGSFEVRRRITPGSVTLQNETIAGLNPLRQRLLMQHDPAGNSLVELAKQPGTVGDNIRTTGYAEVGSLYRPHDTTNWFELGTEVDMNSDVLPDLADLDGAYRAIGLFAIGPYGSCPQLLAEYDLQEY